MSASATPMVSSQLVQPERMVTQSGATAGAGSSEFHIYRAHRRREMERVKRMETDAKKQEENAAFQSEHAAKQAAIDAKTNKNRMKREKKKEKIKLAKSYNIQAKPFPSDGSFMENFLRQQLEKEQAQAQSGGQSDSSDSDDEPEAASAAVSAGENKSSNQDEDSAEPANKKPKV